MLAGYRTKILCVVGVAFSLWRAASAPRVFGAEWVIPPEAWDWLARALEFAAIYFFAAKFPAGFFAQVLAILKELAPLLIQLVEKIRETRPDAPSPSPSPPPDNFSVFNPPEPLGGGVPITHGPDKKTISIGAFFLAALLLSSTAYAESPKAVIQGADPSTSGEIVILDGSSSEGEPTHFSWDISPELRGKRQKLEVETGKRVVIASFPGRYLVTLTVSNADGHSTAHREIVIPGAVPTPSPTPQPDNVIPPQPQPNPQPQPAPPAPGPTPGPVPTPGPPAPVPAPLTGFAADVASWVPLVTSPTRTDEAKRLADASEALASAVAAGAHSGPAAILAALSAANKTALGASITAWAPFGTRYTAALSAKYAAGQLMTNDQWAALLRETAAGLRGAK